MFHVVDDNEQIRDLLDVLITELGYRVRTFASANDYLNFLDSSTFEKPRAVLTDVMMPGMSGYQMMSQVLAVHPEIKFAVISADPDSDDRNKEHACMFLTKPFNMPQVVQMLNNFARCEVEGVGSRYHCAGFGCRDEFGVSGCDCPKANR